MCYVMAKGSEQMAGHRLPQNARAGYQGSLRNPGSSAAFFLPWFPKGDMEECYMIRTLPVLKFHSHSQSSEELWEVCCTP